MTQSDPHQPEPPNLRLLRRLVTALTGVMIFGIIAVVVLMALRLQSPAPPTLPDTVVLPDGMSARAVTFGPGWYAVVTETAEILVFDAATGRLRQRIEIAAPDG